MFRFRLPRKVWLASGYGYIGRGTGREYVTVLNPMHEPLAIVSTIKEARAYIRKLLGK